MNGTLVIPDKIVNKLKEYALLVIRGNKPPPMSNVEKLVLAAIMKAYQEGNLSLSWLRGSNEAEYKPETKTIEQKSSSMMRKGSNGRVWPVSLGVDL